VTLGHRNGEQIIGETAEKAMRTALKLTGPEDVKMVVKERHDTIEQNGQTPTDATMNHEVMTCDLITYEKMKSITRYLIISSH
jgi:hypothetical protein